MDDNNENRAEQAEHKAFLYTKRIRKHIQSGNTTGEDVGGRNYVFDRKKRKKAKKERL